MANHGSLFSNGKRVFLVKNHKTSENLTFEVPKIAKKSKILKSPLWLPRYSQNLSTKANLGHMEHLLVRKMHTSTIFWLKFWLFFQWNCRNRARSTQLWVVITHQRKKISQFCKKFLNPYNSYFNNWLKTSKFPKFASDPPPFPP